VTIVGLNYTPEPTGIAPYTSGLASGLAARGWEVRAVTSYPHYPAWVVSAGYSGRRTDESIDDVRVRRIRPYMPSNPSGMKRLLVEVHFGISSALTYWGRPEVVILVSPALFAVAIAQIRALLSYRRPVVVVWVQDLYGLGVSETGALGSRGAKVMSKIESVILRHADAVVVIHDRFKRFIVSSLGVKTESVSVVRNWTHLTFDNVDRDQFRRKFDWHDEVVVLHAGNMGAKQALENVVEAARLADEVGADIRFVLLGNGNQRAILEALASDVIRIEFMNSLGDLDFQGAMAAADVLLVNEKVGVTEMAVPSKLTSYFASGRPVIVATDPGSITAEEVETAGAGVRVNAGDPAALLHASMSLGRNRELSDELGKNGSAFQARTLSPVVALTHYADIITSLAVDRGR
jgi:colanic acid biosynthesis glycosyl transferase WcaI